MARRTCADDVRSGSEASRRLLALRVAALPERLKQVRAAVRNAAVGAGCSPRCADDVVIAVDEACQNVIRHAYRGDPRGEIVLEIEQQDERLILWLRDFAQPVDTATVEPRDLNEVRPGGLGVHLIRKIMDESGFVPCPSGNTFRMVKRIR